MIRKSSSLTKNPPPAEEKLCTQHEQTGLKRTNHVIDVESVQTGKGVAGEIRATYPIVLKEEEENRQIFLSIRKRYR